MYYLYLHLLPKQQKADCAEHSKPQYDANVAQKQTNNHSSQTKQRQTKTTNRNKESTTNLAPPTPPPPWAGGRPPPHSAGGHWGRAPPTSPPPCAWPRWPRRSSPPRSGPGRTPVASKLASKQMFLFFCFSKGMCLGGVRVFGGGPF